MRSRQRAIAGVFSAMSVLRADRWMAPWTRGAGIVMTLHRVRPDEPSQFSPNHALQITPAFLSLLIDEVREAGFDFIAIDDVLRRLRSARVGTRPFAVLTFDDGYRDNIAFAAPILKAKGVPWTLFVVPEFLSGGGRLWWLELEKILIQLDHLSYETGAGRKPVIANDPGKKLQAFDELRLLCHRLDARRRCDLLDELAQQAGYDRSGLVADHCLGWRDLRAVALTHDVTIGSHTSSHTILPRCSEREAALEIGDSKRRIEARLGHRIEHLAYPHGLTNKERGRDEGLAEMAGYRAAWTTRPAHLTTSIYRSARYKLPRVTISGQHANRATLRAVLSGAPFVGSRAG